MESKKPVDDYQNAFLQMLEPEVIMKEDPLSNDNNNKTSEEDQSMSTLNEDCFNTSPSDVTDNDEINDDSRIEDQLANDIKPERGIKEELQLKHEGKLFSCTHCEYETITKGRFRYHMKSNHGGQKFPCYHCDYESVEKAGLKRHIQSVHEGKKIACPNCDLQVVNLQRHIQSVHLIQKISCTLCKYETTSKRSFQYHMNLSHISCTLCKYKTTKPRSFQYHMKAMHKIIKLEEDHSMTTLNEDSFNTTASEISDEDPLQDDAAIEDLELDLDRIIKQELRKTDEKLVKEVRESQKFSCLHCDYKTNWISSLQTHIRTVHESEKFQWPVSNLKKEVENSHNIMTDVKLENKMDIHKKIREEGEKMGKKRKNKSKKKERGNLKIPCPHCDFKSTLTASLQMHIKTVHECNETINGDAVMEDPKMEMDHTEEAPKLLEQEEIVKKEPGSIYEGKCKKFSCTHCEYATTVYYSFQYHKKSVHGSRKFPCTHCDYESVQKGDLQRHVQSVHEGLKFPCPGPDCKYKATEKGNLRRHIQSVHEGKKFPCPHCEYEASQKGNLKTHIKSSHKHDPLK